MRGRPTTIVLTLWSAAMVAYYALTIADNCGEPERDCAAAIGLGLLASAMIWFVGIGVILLLGAVGGRLIRAAGARRG